MPRPSKYLPETINLGVHALMTSAQIDENDLGDVYRQQLADDVAAVLDAVGYGLAVARAEAAEVTIAAQRETIRDLCVPEDERRAAAAADGFLPEPVLTVPEVVVLREATPRKWQDRNPGQEGKTSTPHPVMLPAGRSVYTIPCRACGAASGARCHDLHTGDLKDMAHTARYDAFTAAQR